MSRFAVLILAVSLLLAACGGEPSPTPDAVATQNAVERAANSTMTAEAPMATATAMPTATATGTPTPMFTPTPIPPTATTAPASPTVTPTLIPPIPATVPRRIAFTSELDTNRDICLIDADGSGLTSLTSDLEWDHLPAWSPDGGQIAFSSNRNGNFNIYVMNVDGSHLTELTNLEDASSAMFPAWSPDGQKIAFKSVNDQGIYEVYAMNADGSVVMLLAEGLDYDGFGEWWSLLPSHLPVWSPDGEQLAVVSGHDDGKLDIYVVNTDGSGLTRLTDDPNHDWLPAWSPDGRQIAFYSGRDGDSNDVYVMNTDGSNQTRLAESAPLDRPFFLSPPAWSPDGQRIAFVSERGSEFDIHLMNADGSDQTRLTHDPGVYEHLTWSPDGDQIAFTSRTEEGTAALFVIDPDDGDPTRLTHDTRWALHPVWSSLSIAKSAPAEGSVEGVLIERESDKPIASAYVLLCAVINPAATEPECLLGGSLTTLTGTDGSFELASVPEGTYVIVYSLSGEAQGSPQTWDGRSVHYNRSPGMLDPFLEGMDAAKGVSISDGSTIDVTGDGIFIANGSITSLEFGLSIEYRERVPLTVSVTGGQTVQVTVKVSAR